MLAYFHTQYSGSRFFGDLFAGRRRTPCERGIRGSLSAFPGRVIPLASKLDLRLSALVASVVGSFLRLADPVPVFCD